jgi:O-acetyl-ADP-ribose deacetylase (regulator of RNase III)
MTVVYAEPGADIFSCGAEALVNPVNCVGVAGKGLALEFKKRFPEAHADYAQACRWGLVKLGEVWVTTIHDGPERNLYVFHFPTKGHWRQKSSLKYIALGIVSLYGAAWGAGVSSIAIPALGCGEGGLDWQDVRPLLHEAFAQGPMVATLFPPR